MNDRTLDQVLQAWLDLGPDVAPDHLHEAVAQEARDTRQAATSWRRWIADSVLSTSTVANIALAGCSDGPGAGGRAGSHDPQPA